jgi:hypothetical protein
VVVLQTDGVAEGKQGEPAPRHRRAEMEQYAGIDVSLDTVTVCIDPSRRSRSLILLARMVATIRRLSERC